MRRSLTTISLYLAVFLILACGHDHSGSRHHDAASHSSNPNQGTAEDGLGLTLNNGARWEMDDHTRAVFVKMAASFLATDHSSLDRNGLKNTASDLRADIDELIQGCTMTGAAHDQLHVYLTGYVPAVAALSESGRIEDTETVKLYLERYDKYFE